MAKGATVSVIITGVTDGLKKAFGEGEKAADGFGEKISKTGKTVALGMAAAGTAVLGFGLNFAKAAAEEEKAQASLAQTVKNVTGATDAQVASVEKFITKTQNATGVLDDELRPAFDALVRGTKDVAKAQDLMSLALDISAGTGKDLGSVTDALSKAYNGNMKALKSLDPSLTGLIKDGASADEVFGSLSQTFEGQAATAANTMSGKLTIAKAKFEDVKESIGAKLIPVLATLATVVSDKIIPGIEKVTGWLGEHKGVTIALAAVIGTVFVAALIAWAVAAASAAAATIAAAAPVIAITVAIAALVAGIIYAYTHWGWFKTAVDAVRDALVLVVRWINDNVVPAFGKMLDIVKGVFGWIQDHWQLLLAILTGPIGAAVILITKNWDTIKAGFTAVKDWIGEKITDIVGYFTALPGRMAGAFTGMFDGIKEAFKSAINFVINGWNSLGFTIPGFDPPGPGPKIPSFNLDVPKITPLAKGGIALSRPGGMLARIGEGGRDEAVLPLPSGWRNGNMGSNSAPVYNVNVYAHPSNNPAEVGREIVATLLAFERSGGNWR